MSTVVRPSAAAPSTEARLRGGLTGRMMLASGLLMLILGAAFVILLLAITDLRETARLSRHSQQVLAVANSLERLVIDMETGQRGFQLTDEERFLEPWEAARVAFPQVSSDLVQLAAVPSQDRRARQIRAAVTSYVNDYSLPLVAALRRGEKPAPIAATSEGKRRADAIRRLFDDFLAAERGLADARRKRSDDAARRAAVAAVGGVGVSVLLVLVFAGYLTRAIVQPVRRAAQMAASLAGGNLSTRMPATGVAEVGRLQRAFNEMAGSLERNRDELAEFAAEQAALRRVASLVARRAPPEQVFSAVAEEMAQRLGADIAKVLRYEPDGTATVVGGWSVPGIHIPVATRLTVEGQGVAVSVLRTHRPARVDRFEGPPGSIAACFADLGIRSGVGSPIIVEDTLWGVAIAGSSRPDGLAAGGEERIADFTELVGTAIANAESRAELAASRARVVAAADETRRRLERDLHDGAQQRLVSLALRLRATASAVPADLGEVHEELARAGTELDEVLADLREISRGIHPAILAEGGIAAALKTLARRSSVPVELGVRADARLPERVEVTAYYVVSEALANVVKHSRASEVHVDVAAEDGLVRLAIRDDGVGGADPARGSGLIGLKDRVEATGGTMTVDSRPGAGTLLLVELPIDGGGAATPASR